MSAFQLLLCTDLDRTLLPNGTQQESPGARELFSRLVSRPEVCLAFASGRDRPLVERAVTNYRLPRPDFVISDVGTNIYDLRSADWQVWQQWQQEIAPDWKSYSHAQLQQLLSGFRALRPQEHAKQNTFKLSYYFPLHIDQKKLHIELQDVLLKRGVQASLVWSADEPAGLGLLDILPARATKLHAIEFLRVSLGVALDETLYAGDSGNDLPLMASHVPSVLVANAMPTMTDEALTAAALQNNQHSLYIAQGGFMGMNGNYSAGILEGFAHYHPEMVDLLQETPGHRPRSEIQ